MLKRVQLPIVTHSITLTCHTNTNSILKNTKIIMAPIDEDMECQIDSGLNVKIEIAKGISTIVTPNKVLTYGDVDFNSTEDLDLFDRLNLKINEFSGFSIPSSYDYNTHTYIKSNNGGNFYQTWDNIKIIKFKHGCLGKPKKIIVFKK